MRVSGALQNCVNLQRSTQHARQMVYNWDPTYWRRNSSLDDFEELAQDDTPGRATILIEQRSLPLSPPLAIMFEGYGMYTHPGWESEYGEHLSECKRSWLGEEYEHNFIRVALAPTGNYYSVLRKTKCVLPMSDSKPEHERVFT